VDTTTITVKEIPIPLWRKLKARAAERGQTIPACLVELLTKALEGKRAA
jgi:plasmid stability protein